MPKITAGTSVKAALLAAFPFLVGINGTEESLHEYLAIFVLLIAVQHLLKQKWWFRMMRFGLRNQPLKLKMNAVLLVSFCCTVISEILVSRYALPAARIKAIQPVMLDLHHFFGYITFFLTFLHVGAHVKARKLFTRMPYLPLFGALLSIPVCFLGLGYFDDEGPLFSLLDSLDLFFFETGKPPVLIITEVFLLGFFMICVGLFTETAVARRRINA